jgi:RNA polymerase sigma-70 factor (ECF subfamily)
VVRPWSRREGITTEAEARADQAAAASALLQLSAPDRDILLALSWDGLSMPELAEVLGCSVASAYVRVHRARGASPPSTLTTVPSSRPSP